METSNNKRKVNNSQDSEEDEIQTQMVPFEVQIPILNLDLDALYHLFSIILDSNLSVFLNLRLVCRDWYCICTSSAYWKRLWYSKFGAPFDQPLPPPPAARTKSDVDDHFVNLLKLRYELIAVLSLCSFYFTPSTMMNSTK